MKVVITNIVMMKLVHLKQKIWHSVREVRDSLMKLERNLKHYQVKERTRNGFKNILQICPRIVFPKIQEKLIKMAKRIGELSA